MVADKRLGSSRKGGRPVRERTIAILRENYNADIKDKIGDAKIGKATRVNWQDCIDAPRRRGAPGAAAHVYRTARAIVNFALKRDYIPGADPMRGIENPKPYRPAPVVAAGDAELKRLFEMLAKSSLWPSTKLAIEFQLLTGARPTEIRFATWDQMNIERQVWTIPAHLVKVDREQRVHLSEQAVALLEHARQIKHTGAVDGKPVPQYVFPGAKGAAMEKRAIGRALTRLAAREVEGSGKRLRPHDLRRTLRTMMSRIGVAPHIAELCLGHLEKETMRRVYDGHDYWNELVEAWNRAGNHLDRLAGRHAEEAASEVD